MPAPILATKLYIPSPRPKTVPRPRLTERLNEGLALGRTPGVTLISAPAGFGKTTLVSEWVVGYDQPIAWLSLDEADNDPVRFLTYLIAALQTVMPDIGAGVLSMLHASPPIESILSSSRKRKTRLMLNDLSRTP